MKIENKKSWLLDLPAELAEQVDATAKRNFMPRAAFIRMALIAKVRDFERQIENSREQAAA